MTLNQFTFFRLYHNRRDLKCKSCQIIITSIILMIILILVTRKIATMHIRYIIHIKCQVCKKIYYYHHHHHHHLLLYCFNSNRYVLIRFTLNNHYQHHKNVNLHQSNSHHLPLVLVTLVLLLLLCVPMIIISMIIILKDN